MKKASQGGFLIAKIHQLSGRLLAKQLKKYRVREINPAQGRILFALWQKDGIPIRELARKTLLEKSTLTSMLDRLEASGHVRRVASPDDRRAIHIHLTQKDAALRAGYLKVSAGMTELFYDGFSETEVARFEGYLERILDNLLRCEERLNGGERTNGRKNGQ